MFKNCPQFIKKYHMIKKLLLLLLLIVFVNPIFAQIEQLGINQRGAATTAFTKETELTIEKPDGVKTGDIMIVTIAQKESDDKSDDNNPVSIGWEFVAGADIEEKGKHAWGAVLYKIAGDADASVTDYTFTLSAPEEAVGAIVAFSGVDVATPFDAIGEITLTEEGKGSDPSTTAITTVSRDAAVLMLGMAKDNIGWDRWNTQGQGILDQMFPPSLIQLFNVPAKPKEKSPSVGAAWAIKQSVGTTGQGTVTTSGKNADKSGTILIALRPSCSASVPNIWDGMVWTYEAAPNDKIIFSKSYPSAINPDVDIEGCSCEVKKDANVIIKEGFTLKIKNEVDVDPKGTLTFENNASLVQINNKAVNRGNIIYKRAVTGIKAKDYVYWSSPVEGQKLADFSSTIKYLWNATLNSWRVPALLDMQIGQGYIIRRDVADDFTGTFTGIPNNGSIKFSIGGTGSFNLIGNPYPSALDADKFLETNSVQNGVLGGTIYFWTHITAITLRAGLPEGTAGSGDLAYTSNDYASYNPTGGVGVEGTKAKSDKSPDSDSKYKPTGKIAAGQAFFATSIASGKTAKFKNYMRVGAAGAILDNSQFFKISSNSKTSNTIEKNRVWLNLTNTQGAFKQTLIGYITGATNEYDNVYDGVSFNGNAFIDFYSTSKDKNFVIQGRALPFDDNDKVPLGYKTTIVGEFKIAIDEVDGFLVNKKIYLEDKLVGKIQDLSLAPYTFTTEKGTYNDRFVLSYTNKTLVTDDFKDLNYGVLISNKNREIKINALANYIDKVFVYDITGKQIFLKSKIDRNEFIISNLESSNQVLIVKVLLQNNKVVTKKVLF
jgi:hypothetical protein